MRERERHSPLSFLCPMTRQSIASYAIMGADTPIPMKLFGSPSCNIKLNEAEARFCNQLVNEEIPLYDEWVKEEKAKHGEDSSKSIAADMVSDDLHLMSVFLNRSIEDKTHDSKGISFFRGVEDWKWMLDMIMEADKEKTITAQLIPKLKQGIAAI